MLIVKIGGSLVTKKEERFKLNLKRLKSYAKFLKRSEDILNGCIVLVLGGGSFGNRTILDLGLQQESKNIAKFDRSRMTETMLAYKLSVIEILRQHEIACFPIQSGVFISTKSGRNVLGYNITTLLAEGIMPVLAGDYYLNRNSKWIILSSDILLVHLAKILRPNKVIVLTDVQGLMDKEHGECLIPRVTIHNYKYALTQATGSSKPDATGGMRFKVQCMIEIAKLGITSIIADGRNASTALSLSFSKEVKGTLFEPWKSH